MGGASAPDLRYLSASIGYRGPLCRRVVGETRVQTQRSSGERRCGVVAPSPAGSVLRVWVGPAG